jgi:hypothetical protein
LQKNIHNSVAIDPQALAQQPDFVAETNLSAWNALHAYLVIRPPQLPSVQGGIHTEIKIRHCVDAFLVDADNRERRQISWTVVSPRIPDSYTLKISRSFT